MRLAILGASGHGKVVADCAEICAWTEIVFFDDAWPEKHKNAHWPIRGNTEQLLQSLTEFDGVIVAIGNNRVRQQKLKILSEAGAPLPTLVHPKAIVSQYARLGCGTVVFAGAVVNADAEIGAGAIVNTSSTVDHDCVLNDGVHVSPGAHLAGGVQVETCAWVGIGASVRQLVHIGADVVVGAGAAVVSDVPDGWTVVGIPARRL